MEKVVQVQLGELRGIGLYNLKDVECKRGDVVVLTVDRGTEYGKIVCPMESAAEGNIEHLPGKVLRLATDEDLKRIAHNKEKAKQAVATCEKKVEEQKLKMKVVHGEYSFDNSKVVFFFISDERVDFRNLVKDLAGIFHARIELKQIGVRDQAKAVGGVGCCGRMLCCTSYMREFIPLTIKMAKEQDLPINPTRISGVCGRIKCCMGYEFPLYKQYSKGMPKRGAKITTPEGKGEVIDINYLERSAKVNLGDGKTTKVIFGANDDE
jgi:cell fate regulator YaaT (PSP1 superfamily)